MARRKTNQLQKIVKKTNPFILLLFALIFVGAGIGGYFFSQSKIANDKFEIVGDKTITMVLGDQPYQDEGAVAISFGRDISDKIVAEENIDYSVAGRYYIKYSVDDIRYKDIYRYRTIIILEVADE